MTVGLCRMNCTEMLHEEDSHTKLSLKKNFLMD